VPGSNVVSRTVRNVASALVSPALRLTIILADYLGSRAGFGPSQRCRWVRPPASKAACPRTT
jgi:hypothetical protein